MKSKIPYPVEIGRHNANLSQTVARLEKGGSYKDLSTICVIPTRGVIPAKVCTAIWNLQSQMNGKFFKFTVEGKEVGQAYNEAVEMILNNAELSKWKYLLTLEEDNLPPPDGLLKLYESMDKYDAVGGLYFTKGFSGMPMIYGSPTEFPKDFKPQVPVPDAVQPCNGLGMGFTLFKISMFKKLRDRGVCPPFFKTVQEYEPGIGAKLMTQDLFFFQLAGREGFSFASDNRVKVGHLDVETGEIW
jgi:hypothetical protein